MMQPMSAGLPTLQPPLPQTNTPLGGDRVFIDSEVAVTNTATGVYAGKFTANPGAGNIGNATITAAGVFRLAGASFNSTFIGGTVVISGAAAPGNDGTFAITGVIPAERLQLAGSTFSDANLDVEGVTIVIAPPAICTFKMDIPSTKLHPALTVGYRLDSGEADNPLPASGVTAWTLQLDAWSMTKEGIWIPGNNIVTGLPLGTVYEAVTGVRQWRGKITVPNRPGTGIAPGKLYVIARWEVASGAAPMPDAELARIFQACKLNVQGINSSTTGS